MPWREKNCLGCQSDAREFSPPCSDSADHKLLLTVPEAAVATRTGRAVIYQIRDDRAVEVPVSTGQKLGALIEIKSGIKEGDKIIAKVDDRIEAGAKVAVKGP